MSFVNEKGGFHKKIQILQNDSNESVTTLRHAFLKKVENYSLQIEDFYLNKMPVIHQNDDEFDIEIQQFDESWRHHMMRDIHRPLLKPAKTRSPNLAAL